MSDETLREYTREELLLLHPADYLAEGVADAAGRPRAGLLTTYATAAATQLLAAQLSPQEFAFTLEAFRQSLELQEGSAPERARAALAEAFETVHGMIQQRNNSGLTTWMNECASAVKTPADLDALREHFLAVLRQYDFLASLQPSE